MTIANATVKYPTVADPFGDWSRDTPWMRTRTHFVTTYSRRATDGRFQKAQVRVRRDLFDQQFAEIDIASTLRYADYCDRTDPRRRKLYLRGRG